jgi:hypothetical protein
MPSSYLEQFNELSQLISQINTADVSLENVDESYCEIMRDAISLMSETDKYLLECADYDKRELVNLFSQVSMISDEISESHKKISSTSWNELSNGTYAKIEQEKMRCDIAKEAMNRISKSICMRARLKTLSK